jgi:hypothetical protein
MRRKVVPSLLNSDYFEDLYSEIADLLMVKTGRDVNFSG